MSNLYQTLSTILKYLFQGRNYVRKIHDAIINSCTVWCPRPSLKLFFSKGHQEDYDDNPCLNMILGNTQFFSNLHFEQENVQKALSIQQTNQLLWILIFHFLLPSLPSILKIFVQSFEVLKPLHPFRGNVGFSYFWILMRRWWYCWCFEGTQDDIYHFIWGLHIEESGFKWAQVSPRLADLADLRLAWA